MNEVQQGLHIATFRGVPFLFCSSQRSGGRKAVQHEYPNTDKRWVEDLGKTVPTFSIDALISGQADYYLKRDRFTQALEKFGPGLLSHPFYGTLNVHVIDYTLDEGTDSLGRAEYSINFAITGKENSPVSGSSGAPLIRLRTESIVQKTVNFIQTKYQPSVLNKVQHSYNVGLIRNVLLYMNTGVSVILQQKKLNNSDIQNTRSYLKGVDNNADSIVADKTQMANAIGTGFSYFDDIDLDAIVAYNAYESMFGFRKNEPIPKVTTIQKEKNLENHYLITGAFNVLALVYAYDSASNIDYVTSDDVELVRSKLEAQYQYILGIPNLDFDVLDNLRDIRTSMREFFNSINKKVFRIVSVNTPQMPLAVLVYQYYGNLDNLDEIQKINNIAELPFVSGSIRMLSQ